MPQHGLILGSLSLLDDNMVLRSWNQIGISYFGTVLHRSIKSAPKDPSNEIQVGIRVSRLPLTRIFIMRFTQIMMRISLNKIHCVVLESQVTTQVDSRMLFLVQSVGLSTETRFDHRHSQKISSRSLPTACSRTRRLNYSHVTTSFVQI